MEAMQGDHGGFSGNICKAEDKIKTLDIQILTRHAEYAVPRCEPHTIEKNLSVILPPLWVIAGGHEARFREKGRFYAD
jgi:hypothetical protein